MVQKDITFIYNDAVQKEVYEMIAVEAKKRGYKTSMTDNKFTKCEIGWYCDHVNHPQFSKFSVIMLHDIMQQFGNWPDIWFREPWNKYDIGFLPSKVWIDNWVKCSQWYYTKPRKGVYLTGWPKADSVQRYFNSENIARFEREIGINPQLKTVLYAPAWENDHKQDDFVQAMLKLNVNIVVKQAPWPKSYPEQIANIKEMYDLHKHNSRVILVNPQTNIFNVIAICDILVSEESSTMSEAVMMGKPAISVNNWLIPDVKPSRFPANNYDYIVKTDKEHLTECVNEVITNYPKYQQDARNYSTTHFANIGKCIPMMMDILDSAINEDGKIYKCLKAKSEKKLTFSRYIQHLLIISKREIVTNYCVRNYILRQLYSVYGKIRNKLNKNKK